MEVEELSTPVKSQSQGGESKEKDEWVTADVAEAKHVQQEQNQVRGTPPASESKESREPMTATSASLPQHKADDAKEDRAEEKNETKTETEMKSAESKEKEKEREIKKEKKRQQKEEDDEEMMKIHMENAANLFDENGFLLAEEFKPWETASYTSMTKASDGRQLRAVKLLIPLESLPPEVVEAKLNNLYINDVDAQRRLDLKKSRSKMNLHNGDGGEDDDISLQPYEFGFVGQVNPEGKPHGFGTFMWPDMSIYEGQWLDGDRHGWGKHVFPSGDSYEGQWRYNLQYGEGQMVYASDYGPNQVYIAGVVYPRRPEEGLDRQHYEGSNYCGERSGNPDRGIDDPGLDNEDLASNASISKFNQLMNYNPLGLKEPLTNRPLIWGEPLRDKVYNPTMLNQMMEGGAHNTPNTSTHILNARLAEIDAAQNNNNNNRISTHSPKKLALKPGGKFGYGGSQKIVPSSSEDQLEDGDEGGGLNELEGGYNEFTREHVRARLKYTSVRHGMGKYEWPDGSSYNGAWYNDFMHGIGSFLGPPNSRIKSRPPSPEAVAAGVARAVMDSDGDVSPNPRAAPLLNDKSSMNGSKSSSKSGKNSPQSPLKYSANTSSNSASPVLGDSSGSSGLEIAISISSPSGSRPGSPGSPGKRIALSTKKKSPPRMDTQFRGIPKHTKDKGRGMQGGTSGISEVASIDTYDGEFYKGKRQGQGKITYKDGSVYVGQWVFDERCGQGTEYFKNGDRYEGGWEGDLMHGQGFFVWTDGRTYKGEFKHGERHGEGRVDYLDGSIDQGPWVADLFKGVNFKPDEDYVGEYNMTRDSYLYGTKLGWGKKVWSDGSGRSYEGQWNANKMVGNVAKMINFFDEKGSVYEGVVVSNGIPHGRGRRVYANGDVYVGTFDKGKRHGNGTMTYINGVVYGGEWFQNRSMRRGGRLK